MIAKIGRTLPLLLGGLGLLAAPSDVLAQGNVFNPYGNSGYADYREFGNPIYSSNPSLPGQSLLNSEPAITRPRANSFQQYTDDFEGGGSSSFNRGGSSNLPYFQAYQRLNSQNNRAYRPGEFSKQERDFNERQKQRDAAYVAARAETDPVKRAKLMRQVEQDSLVRSSAAATPKSNAGRVAAPSANRAPAPPISGATPSPGASRTRAPSPSSGSTARRPNTTTPAPSLDRPKAAGRPAPDPSSIPVPPPR